MTLRKLPLLLAPFLFAAAPAGADVVLNSTGRGWYNDLGRAAPSDNYQVGSSGVESRNWFTFDLSGVTGTVTSATLVLYEPMYGFNSADSFDNPLNTSETIRLYDVTSTGLAANGSEGNSAIFADLGGGVLYGSLSVSAANDGSYLSITLNSAFIAAVNANRGGSISMGGAMASVGSDSTVNRFLFLASQTGNAADGNSRLQLVTVVPEPSAYGLAAAGAVASAAWVRRRRKR